MTIGIKPTYPETGYGYIKAKPGGGPVYPVDTFVEKPDIDRARQYYESGNYFWNSGIFVWKTSVILQQFSKLLPATWTPSSRWPALNPADISSNEGRAVGYQETDIRCG